MSKSNDEIYELIVNLRGDFNTFSAKCNLKHEAIDDKVHVLDKEINGNGQPGLKDKHLTLEGRFDRMEIRITAAVAVVTFVLNVLPKAIAIFKH